MKAGVHQEAGAATVMTSEAIVDAGVHPVGKEEVTGGKPSNTEAICQSPEPMALALTPPADQGRKQPPNKPEAPTIVVVALLARTARGMTAHAGANISAYPPPSELPRKPSASLSMTGATAFSPSRSDLSRKRHPS